MRVAICGAGMVGSYLFRLLSQTGRNTITLHEKPGAVGTNCGIRPCAWGVSSGFEELLRCVALDPSKYILRSFEYMVMNGLKVKARALVIDKPKLITDLCQGAKIETHPVILNDYGRLIDATGYTRALLPPIVKDVIADCIQYRVVSRKTREFSVDISNLGYAWCFPMSGDEYHIGAGSISLSPQEMLQKLGWLKDSETICNCAGKARLTAPYYSIPFVNTTNDRRCQIWGAGEAIGCVAPLAGEGIVPGMMSARILIENWEHPDSYEKAILEEFAWMKAERKVLDKAVQGKRLGLIDARAFMNSTKRFKMDLSYGQSLSLLRSINRIEA